ncbi:MAG: type II 3-dehydroquinate dehydratase [Microbacteriaceae bacterium]|nr:type II 3-dehydroquinate dehydratase [Microbacteriaceae bacterium]
MTQVLILNGPNLNRLGSREPDVYGTQSYEDLVAIAQVEADRLGFTVSVKQSNDEAELINWIHEAVDSSTHVIINPAAFTHYSYALRDACALITTAGLKLIEVHISNPHARETFRHTSVISGVATGVIAGFGLDSYRLALVQLSH